MKINPQPPTPTQVIGKAAEMADICRTWPTNCCQLLRFSEKSSFQTGDRKGGARARRMARHCPWTGRLLGLHPLALCLSVSLSLSLTHTHTRSCSLLLFSPLLSALQSTDREFFIENLLVKKTLISAPVEWPGRLHGLHPNPRTLQGYLAYQKPPTHLEQHRALGIGLLYGPEGGLFLMSQVPLYLSAERESSLLTIYSSESTIIWMIWWTGLAP